MQKKISPAHWESCSTLGKIHFYSTWMALDYVCLFVNSFIHSSNIYHMQSSVLMICLYLALAFKIKDCYCKSRLSIFWLCLYSSSNMSSVAFTISLNRKAKPSSSSKSTSCWNGLNPQKVQPGGQWLRQGLQMEVHTKPHTYGHVCEETGKSTWLFYSRFPERKRGLGVILTAAEI